MNKIVLNETHIRQLVRETLENLILGEDDINNIDNNSTYQNLKIEEVFNIISKSEDIWIENYEIDEYYGTINMIGEFRNYNSEELISYEMILYVDVAGYNEKTDDIDYDITSFAFEIDEDGETRCEFELSNEIMKENFFKSLPSKGFTQIDKLFTEDENVYNYVNNYQPYLMSDYDNSADKFDEWWSEHRGQRD